MSAIPYTYSVIRYVHDPAVGETLNVGVILYAPSVPYVGARLDHHYERLSHAFAEFDGDHYRKTRRQFEAAIGRLRSHWNGTLPALLNLPSDVGGVGALIWPDAGVSFRFGPVLAGLADDMDEALSALVSRMVTSQYERPHVEKRSDEAVWSVYHRPIAQKAINKVLRPKLFTTPEFELGFEHSFKNERWHVLQPVSMDYAKPEALQAKATRWLGNAVALKDHPDLGKLYLLLGPPQLEAHRAAYVRAKNLLHKIPVPHELVEENDAEEFARKLAAYMREHGVIGDVDGG